MIIYDENNNIIENPDLTLGHLELRTKTIHHDAIQEVQEVSHYEVIATYPNGGKDLRKVIDTPAVYPVEAWDEEIVYQLYILYTQEELDEINGTDEEEDDTPDPMEERIAALEEQNEMLMECVLEMSELLYA